MRGIADKQYVVYECRIGYNTAGMKRQIFGIGATKNCVFGTLDNGNFKDNSGNVELAFNAGQMYKVTYVLDITNKQYDLYIDEVKKTNTPVTYANFDGFLADNLSKTIRLNAASQSDDVTNDDIMIDDIKIYSK